MKYIELKPGLNIQKESIIAVEEVDMMSCKVQTIAGSYDSIYPSWRILMLLETPTIEEQIAMQPIDKPDTSTRNLWGNQHWAG